MYTPVSVFSKTDTKLDKHILIIFLIVFIYKYRSYNKSEGVPCIYYLIGSPDSFIHSRSSVLISLYYILGIQAKSDCCVSIMFCSKYRLNICKLCDKPQFAKFLASKKIYCLCK